jgi:hypothetical protein
MQFRAQVDDLISGGIFMFTKLIIYHFKYSYIKIKMIVLITLILVKERKWKSLI